MKENIGISVISKACGVKVHSIRTWETRYQVFSPDRASNGQRVYSRLDLERAKLIGSLLSKGVSISKLSPLTLDELKEMVQSTEEIVVESEDFVSASVKNLFANLQDYKIDGVLAELQHLRMNTSSKDFIFKVVLPVMQEIGMKVARDDFSVTQEHIISTLIRDQIAQINLPNFTDSDSKVILATPDGNLHELSILIADILCRSNRVSTSYLGASHPAQCLGEATNALKIETIVMGVVSSDKWDYGKSMISYLKELDKYLDIKISVILGGGSELEFPKFKNIKEVRVVKDFESFDNLMLNPNFFLNSYL